MMLGEKTIQLIWVLCFIVGGKEIAQLLIEKGADVNNRNAGGFTPLHESAIYGKRIKNLENKMVQ